MKKVRIYGSAFLLLVIAAIVFAACQKSLNGTSETIPAGKNKLSIYLLDGPLDYQQVNIDIQAIYVKVDTCKHYDDEDKDCDDYKDSVEKECDIWDTLSIHPGVYDLLKLQNGVDTLLASGFVPQGHIEKIKFVLGTNNTVMVDSSIKPLNLKDGKNYIYFKIGHENIDSISNNNLELFLDFDLARSIKYENGKYWLKPSIKPFGNHATGEIEGKVRPVDAHGMIKAYNTTDTAFAFPDHHEGEFKIRGLKPGTYSVFIEGKNGYKDSIISNVDVKRDRETDLGKIVLRK